MIITPPSFVPEWGYFSLAGEVHLTPVHVVQQFRPTFEHCEQDSREDTLSEKTGGVIPFSRRKQTDRQIELMAKSYPYFAASEADDRLEAFRLYQSHVSDDPAFHSFLCVVECVGV